MRGAAAGIAYQQNIVKKFVITGGHNFFVRYALDPSVPVYGTVKDPQRQKELKKKGYKAKADYRKHTKEKAKQYPSEAEALAQFLNNKYNVSLKQIVLEKKARNTEENAVYCRSLLQEKNWLDKSIALLTHLYHMERAIEHFQKTGVKVEPLYVEDILGKVDPVWIERICKYYSSPKGGKEYNVEKMKKLLSQGETVGKLM